MKNTLVLVASLAVVFGAVSCKKAGPPAEAAYPVRIETVDGVRTVLNPSFPKKGVQRFGLREDLSIGGEEGGAESVLNRPQALAVDAQGGIYVMDWGDVDIKVFAPDGRLLRKFGKQGQGPGEFDIPAYFTRAADGRIFLLSGRQHRIIILDQEGTYLSSFRLDGFCDALGVDSRNRVYCSRFLTPEPRLGEAYELLQNRMALFRTDEKGTERTALGEYPNGLMLMKMMNVGGQAGVQSMSSRESPKTSWLVGPGDRIYLGFNKDYLLTVYDPDWKPVLRFGREFTPLRHPEYKPEGPHPEFYPAFSDWHKFFDAEGNLWLEQYVEEGLKDHVYDIFSPEGIYVKQIRVPETLFLVRGDVAYSIIRQEDEFLVVKRFRLVPEAAADK
jgi:hypothetical protein